MYIATIDHALKTCKNGNILCSRTCKPCVVIDSPNDDKHRIR